MYEMTDFTKVHILPWINQNDLEPLSCLVSLFLPKKLLRFSLSIKFFNRWKSITKKFHKVCFMLIANIKI